MVLVYTLDIGSIRAEMEGFEKIKVSPGPYPAKNSPEDYFI